MPTPRLLIVAMLASVVAVAYEAVAVATAMPAAGRALGHLGLYAWTFTLFVIGMGLGTVLAGRLSDRLGPVPSLLGGLACFALGLVLATLAPTMHLLLVARFVQGLGGGAFSVSMMVVVAKLFEPSRQASIMTAFSMCWVLPAFFAPPLAAWLTHHLSWHWVFGVAIPPVLGTILVAGWQLRAMREQLRPVEGDADPVPVWAAVVVSLGLAGVQTAGQRLDWLSVPLLVAGLGMMALALPRMMPAGFFRLAPGIAAVVWSRALIAGAFFGAEAFLPLSLVTIRGLSLFVAGLTLTVGSVGWSTASWLQSRPWLPLRRDQLIGAGMLAVFAGIGSVAVGTGLGWSVVAICAGWTLAGFGMGLAIASSSLAIMALAEPARIGRHTSSLQLGESIGNALFTGLAGTVYANLRLEQGAATTFGAVFWTVAAVAGVGLLVTRRIGPVANSTSGAGL